MEKQFYLAMILGADQTTPNEALEKGLDRRASHIWLVSAGLWFVLLAATLVGLSGEVRAALPNCAANNLPDALSNASGPACGPDFTQVASANAGSIANYLFGIAVAFFNTLGGL